MSKDHAYYCLFVLLGCCAAGCSDAEVPDSSGKANQAAQKPGLPESPKDAPAPSDVLEQELIDVAMEVMKAQDASADPTKARRQAEEAIAEMRKVDREFLMVPADVEEKLRANTPLQDSAERIAVAEDFFSEFGIQLSGIANSLLPQHKAGTLTPVRTELLAQLMIADMKKVKDALTAETPPAAATAFLVDMDGVKHRLPVAEANLLAKLISAQPDVDTTDHVKLDPPYRVIVDGVDLALQPDELVLMHRGGTMSWNSAGVRARVLAVAGIK